MSHLAHTGTWVKIETKDLVVALKAPGRARKQLGAGARGQLGSLPMKQKSWGVV